MCNPRPGWVNGAIHVCKCCPRIEKLFLVYSLYILSCHLSANLLNLVFVFFVIFVSGISGLIISSVHKADHSYLAYQITMVTNFPVLCICNYLSILPKIIMFQFQFSVKVVSADGPVLQCQGICCHYTDLSFMLIWWLWFLGSYASVAVFTFADCSLKRMLFFKGCLWDGCLWCLRYIIGNLVWYLFLTYGLIEMFSVAIYKKVCALV